MIRTSELVLFLGYRLDAPLQDSLEQNFQIAAFFIGERQDCLREIEYQNERYLGKFLGKRVDLNSLELLQENIYSILKKINSDLSCKTVPLVLFPIEYQPTK